MSDIVVDIKDVYKEFILSHSGVGSIKTLLLWWTRKKSKEKLKVLNGVSFQVKKGECVALIGRNGAGKSTLLSLIARVYKPNAGEIVVNGRIGPLLELGAGFHPDLSGHENIIFNAMMLGLSRKEAEARVERIIEFSELRSHINAPVRTYSSGMEARLGFAVAINVDAEILIVDEALAVGDYSFEQKCYKYIDEFRANGGSILFVSHNVPAVERVAERCIWLKDGNIYKEGTPAEILPMYQAEMTDQK